MQSPSPSQLHARSAAYRAIVGPLKDPVSALQRPLAPPTPPVLSGMGWLEPAILAGWSQLDRRTMLVITAARSLIPSHTALD